MNVSLEDKEAKVSYNTDDVTAEQIAARIEEMGFSAFVKEVNGKALRTTVNPASNNNNLRNGEVPLPMNGGGDVKAQDKMAKCFLHITVSKVENKGSL